MVSKADFFRRPWALNSEARGMSWKLMIRSIELTSPNLGWLELPKRQLEVMEAPSSRTLKKSGYDRTSCKEARLGSPLLSVDTQSLIWIGPPFCGFRDMRAGKLQAADCVPDLKSQISPLTRSWQCQTNLCTDNCKSLPTHGRNTVTSVLFILFLFQSRFHFSETIAIRASLAGFGLCGRGTNRFRTAGSRARARPEFIPSSEDNLSSQTLKTTSGMVRLAASRNGWVVLGDEPVNLHASCVLDCLFLASGETLQNSSCWPTCCWLKKMEEIWC